jgi:hypothetical protein
VNGTTQFVDFAIFEPDRLAAYPAMWSGIISSHNGLQRVAVLTGAAASYGRNGGYAD